MYHTIKMTVLFVSAVCFYLVIATLWPLRAAEPPAVGAPLPNLDLPVPGNQDHRQYLGLPDKGMFQIPRIKADVVITEIFSLYCPYCQREAPLINELYEKIKKDPNLKERIKLIGIGAGNTGFEVQMFREKYRVLFPLFSDEDYKAHKCLGETRTPYFIVIKIDVNGSHRVIYSKLGSIKNPDDFLKDIKELAGIH